MIWKGHCQLYVDKARIIAFLTVICNIWYTQALEHCSNETYKPCTSGILLDLPDEWACVSVHTHVRLTCEQAEKVCQKDLEGRLLQNRLQSEPFSTQLRKILKGDTEKIYWISSDYTSGKKRSLNCTAINGDATVSTTGVVSPALKNPLALPFICESSERFSKENVDITMHMNSAFGLPSYDVFYTGKPVEVKCQTIHSIWWHISWKWKNRTEQLQLNKQDSYIDITSSWDMIKPNTYNSCVARSRSILRVPPLGGRHGEITCAFYSNNKPFDVWKSCNQSDGVFCQSQKYEVLCDIEPRLSVKYPTRDKGVYYGQVLTAVCIADFKVKDGNISWTITTSAPNGDEPYQSGPSRLEELDSSHACKSRVTSHIELPITLDYVRFHLVCKRYRVAINSSRNETLKFQRLAEIDIEVEYGPQEPAMSIDDSEFDLGGRLTVTCTACVGNRGAITWAIIHETGLPFPPTVLQALTLERKVVEEPNVPYCGKYVTSRLVLNVTETLLGTRLLCSSSNGLYVEGLNTTATSRTLSIHDVHEKWQSYIIRATPLLVILTVLAICFLYAKWSKEKDETINIDKKRRNSKFKSGRKARQRNRRDRKTPSRFKPSQNTKRKHRRGSIKDHPLRSERRGRGVNAPPPRHLQGKHPTSQKPKKLWGKTQEKQQTSRLDLDRDLDPALAPGVLGETPKTSFDSKDSFKDYPKPPGPKANRDSIWSLFRRARSIDEGSVLSVERNPVAGRSGTKL